MVRIMLRKRIAVPFHESMQKKDKSLEKFLVALCILYRAEIKREWTVLVFFWGKVTGDKGTHSTLLVRESGGAVPALLALLDEQSSLSFGTLLKPPRSGWNILKAFGQIYSPPFLEVPPKRQSSIQMSVLIHPQTKRRILRIYRPCFSPAGFRAVV